MALEDSTEGPEFADSYIIADAVMQSLTSSLTAYNVLGAHGSSEPRRKSRSPPREIPSRSGRSLPGAPSSRGTRRSGVSPATAPTRNRATTGSETFLSPMTRKFSTVSVRSHQFGGVASTSVEQSVAQMAASMQQQLMRDCQEIGPLIGSGRVSPRVVQIGSMMLYGFRPPLAPPSEARGQSRMEYHYEAVMRELHAKHDEVAALSAQRSDQERAIQLAEAHLRTTESQWRVESRQRDLAAPMAREVGAGQAAVSQQYEREKVEQTVQAIRLCSAVGDADKKVECLESCSVDRTPWLKKLRSSYPDLCPPLMRWRVKPYSSSTFLSVQNEEMTHAPQTNDELETSWNHLASANATLRAQLNAAKIGHSSEQQDSSMRIEDDLRIRGELTARLARAVVWKTSCAQQESKYNNTSQKLLPIRDSLRKRYPP